MHGMLSNLAYQIARGVAKAWFDEMREQRRIDFERGTDEDRDLLRAVNDRVRKSYSSGLEHTSSDDTPTEVMDISSQA
jgi:hypothetical protein